MKYIYKIGVIALLLTFASCAVDDDAAIQSNGTIVEASLNNAIVSADEGATSVNVPISFSAPLSGLSRVNYLLNGNEMSADFNSGASSSAIEVDMTGLSVATVELTNFTTLYESAQNIVTNIGENNVSTIIVGNDLTLNLTWTDGASDIDVAVWELPIPSLPIDLFGNGAGNVASATFINTSNENLVLPSSIPDGDYGYVVLPFDIGSSSIACELEVISSSVGIQNFSFSIDNAEAGSFDGGQLLYPSAQQVLSITKSTSDGVVSWSISQ